MMTTTEIKEVRAENEALKAEVIRLRELLRPFAKMHVTLFNTPDTYIAWKEFDRLGNLCVVTCGEVRAAAKELGEE